MSGELQTLYPQELSWFAFVWHLRAGVCYAYSWEIKGLYKGLSLLSDVPGTLLVSEGGL